jgi:four helix bundle protein
MQNEKEKFKENFVKRLVRFSVNIINFAERIKIRQVMWPIADQLIRSATSIGANVVEAKSSSSKRDYLHFFEIALKSANETKYWLIVIKESVVELKKETELLYQEADELSKIIASSVLTLKGKK